MVTVIVVNYNCKGYIVNCINSLLNQTYPDIEIIVVDNASTDSSSEDLKRRFSGKIKFIFNKKNWGFAEGNNMGIKLAKGEYIAFLNPDAVADERWIEELIKGMERYKAGACASKVLYLDDPEVINSAGVVLIKDLTALNQGMGEKDKGQYDKVEEVFGFYGAACIVKKSLLDEIGGFDPDYFMHREEDELAWKIRLNGWCIFYIPTAKVYHKRSVTTGIGTLSKLYYGERNRLWNVLKFLPLDLIIFSFFFSLLRYFYSLSFMLFGQKNAKLSKTRVGIISILLTLIKAWVDALIYSGRMIKKRKKIAKICPGISSKISRKILRRFSYKLEYVKVLFK